MEDFIADDDDDIRRINPLVLPFVVLAVIAVGIGTFYWPFIVPTAVASFVGGAIGMFWLMEWANDGA